MLAGRGAETRGVMSATRGNRSLGKEWRQKPCNSFAYTTLSCPPDGHNHPLWKEATRSLNAPSRSSSTALHMAVGHSSTPTTPTALRKIGPHSMTSVSAVSEKEHHIVFICPLFSGAREHLGISPYRTLLFETHEGAKLLHSSTKPLLRKSPPKSRGCQDFPKSIRRRIGISGMTILQLSHWRKSPETASLNPVYSSQIYRYFCSYLQRPP